jgi:hypothetical protein
VKAEKRRETGVNCRAGGDIQLIGSGFAGDLSREANGIRGFVSNDL